MLSDWTATTIAERYPAPGGPETESRSSSLRCSFMVETENLNQKQ